MANRQVKKKFKEAADIAKSVPKEFQEAAFNRALDMLMENGVAPETIRARLLGLASPEAVVERSIEVLSFATRTLGKEAVSAAQIAAMLNAQYGLAVSKEIVARTLATAGGAVQTVRRGGDTLFRPVPAEEAPAAKKKTSAKKATKKAETEARPGEILGDLAAMGFFTTARSATDVALYLQKLGLGVTKRQIAPVLGRMLAEGELDRERNDDGEYEYQAS